MGQNVNSERIIFNFDLIGLRFASAAENIAIFSSPIPILKFSLHHVWVEFYLILNGINVSDVNGTDD